METTFSKQLTNPDDPSSIPRSRKKTKGGRYTSDITYKELEQYFHLPTDKACEKLGIGLTVLKRVCRNLGIERWPYQKRAGNTIITNEYTSNGSRQPSSDHSSVHRKSQQGTEEVMKHSEDEKQCIDSPVAKKPTLHHLNEQYNIPQQISPSNNPNSEKMNALLLALDQQKKPSPQHAQQHTHQHQPYHQYQYNQYAPPSLMHNHSSYNNAYKHYQPLPNYTAPVPPPSQYHTNNNNNTYNNNAFAPTPNINQPLAATLQHAVVALSQYMEQPSAVEALRKALENDPGMAQQVGELIKHLEQQNTTQQMQGNNTSTVDASLQHFHRLNELREIQQQHKHTMATQANNPWSTTTTVTAPSLSGGSSAKQALDNNVKIEQGIDAHADPQYIAKLKELKSKIAHFQSRLSALQESLSSHLGEKHEAAAAAHSEERGSDAENAREEDGGPSTLSKEDKELVHSLFVTIIKQLGDGDLGDRIALV